MPDEPGDVPPCENDPAHGPAYACAARPGAIYGQPGPDGWALLSYGKADEPGWFLVEDAEPYWGDYCRACFDRLGCRLGPHRGDRYSDDVPD